MQLTKGYKQTEVGVIPEDWNITQLGKLATFLSGGTPSRSNDGYWEGDIPWISATSLRRFYIFRSDSNVTKEAVESGSKMAPIGSTLLLVRGSALHKEILSGLVTDPVCFNQDVKALIPSQMIDPKYLTFVTRGKADRLLKLVSSAGNTAGVLDTKLLKGFSIPLPPTKAEQEAIAEALSDTDAWIESLEQLIAKKRRIKAGSMQTLLTGKQRLPGFVGEWEVKTLGDLGTWLKGSGVRKDESKSGTLPCVRYGEIYTLHQDYIRKFHSSISREVASTATQIRSGDILFAGSGETKEDIGKCIAYTDDVEAYAGGDIVILRTKGVSPKFLGFYLNTPDVSRQKSSKGQGDAVVHISATALSGISIKIPKSAEQTATAAILSDMDSELDALEAKLSKARQIKQGMMQELLTGKTRLING